MLTLDPWTLYYHLSRTTYYHVLLSIKSYFNNLLRLWKSITHLTAGMSVCISISISVQINVGMHLICIYTCHIHMHLKAPHMSRSREYIFIQAHTCISTCSKQSSHDHSKKFWVFAMFFRHSQSVLFSVHLILCSRLCSSSFHLAVLLISGSQWSFLLQGLWIPHCLKFSHLSFWCVHLISSFNVSHWKGPPVK